MSVGKFSRCMCARRYEVCKVRDVVAILMCDMIAKGECSG